jgi:hypothetical protein
VYFTLSKPYKKAMTDEQMKTIKAEATPSEAIRGF